MKLKRFGDVLEGLRNLMNFEFNDFEVWMIDL